MLLIIATDFFSILFKLIILYQISTFLLTLIIEPKAWNWEAGRIYWKEPRWQSSRQYCPSYCIWCYEAESNGKLFIDTYWDYEPLYFSIHEKRFLYFILVIILKELSNISEPLGSFLSMAKKNKIYNEWFRGKTYLRNHGWNENNI